MSTTKKCPNGHEVSPMNEFCGQCGAKLMGVPHPDCPKCGHLVWSHRTFCPSCGELYPMEMRQRDTATLQALASKRRGR